MKSVFHSNAMVVLSAALLMMVLFLTPHIALHHAKHDKSHKSVAHGDLRLIKPAAIIRGASAKTGVIYLDIANIGAADRLIDADSNSAKRTELHETIDNDGIFKMRPVVDGLEIAPNDQIALSPGGLHIMLIDLQDDLHDQNALELTLTFERAGAVRLNVPINPKSRRGAGKQHHHH